MPKFFCDNISDNQIIITGEDARHIGKVLRMKPGEEVDISASDGMDYHCSIHQMTGEEVTLTILSSQPNESEPSLFLTLYQALPKGDKMEWIIQKSVELGVSRIVPVMTHRCVSRPDPKSMSKKIQRWQKIADEAAKQCGRGKLVKVDNTMSFQQAVQDACSLEVSMLCYEKGGKRLNEIISPSVRTAGVFVGAEGGFEPEEADAAAAAGMIPATLGKLILRCETAPLAAISILMNLTENI